jgi:GNAT superfamily N-acetyltransferase
MKRKIRAIELEDKEKWRELWLGYCQFYKMNLSEDNVAHLWSRIHNPSSSIFAICSIDEKGNILGIIHYVLHESTSQLRPICCLQDLFVDQASRNNGIGYELIEWLLTEMKKCGWGRVYWHTRENNYRARALYDKFSSQNDFLRYVVENSNR